MGEKKKYRAVVSVFLIVLMAASAIAGAGVINSQNSTIVEIANPQNMNKNADHVTIFTASANQQPSSLKDVTENDCGCGDGSVYIVLEGGLSSEDIAALQEQGKKEGWTFTVGENSVTNRSLKTLCGTIVDDEDQSKTLFDPEPLDSLPDKFDWRDPNYNPTGRNCMTLIKDQGQCGSCWAFATCGILECNIKIEDGDTLDLSEQHLVSCNTDGWGCSGGSICPEYYKDEQDVCGRTGAVLEHDFPYVASNAPCNCDYPRTYTIDNHGSVGSSVGAIKQAIYDYGPVAAICYPNDAFQSYSGGVFNDCTPGLLGHGVVLVGWDDNQGTNGIWFLRNSWGTGWGENGYMRIEYGCCDIGDFGNEYIVYSGGWNKNTTYGIDYYFASGDVDPYGSHSIRMGEEIFGPDGQAWYMFNIGNDAINDNLHVGIYFCDWGWWPGGDGPSIYINNWSKTPQPSWDLLQHDLGNHDDYRWAWVGTFNANDHYVNRNDNNKIYVKIYAESDDDTILDTIAIKYFYAQPDLTCTDANLEWDDVEPGDTVYGSFKVKNVGDSYSKLSWEMNSSFIPSWGNWTFNPSSGTGLTPEDGPVTVQVEVVAPNAYGTSYCGDLRVENTENPNYDFKMLHYNLTTRDAIPDLSCSGSLSWTNVIPETTVTGSFTVENIGNPTSELDWQITEWPSWGTSWTFVPSSGTGLTPEDGFVTIQVSVVAPDQYDETYTGQVKIANLENSSDYCFIPVSLTTSLAPIPDLECTGDLNWTDVFPGETVTGSFTVENVGDSGSELDWEITDWPTWGAWSFNPSSGQNLKPEDGPVTIQVTVVAPNQPEQTFTGVVTIENQEDSSDYDTINAFMATITAVPDLEIEGTLTWYDVEPGDTVTKDIYVKNVGDPGSELNWEITDWPNWGTWTFSPSMGFNLKPEDGKIKVKVTVVAPNQPEQIFTGILKIENSDDDTDFCVINVILETTIINDPPSKPTITGPTNGEAGQSYDYDFTATDPDDNDIRFYIKWGDGYEDGWLGPYASGTIITKSHTWLDEGSYIIRAKAKDVHDEESDWGTLEVSMPFIQQAIPYQFNSRSYGLIEPFITIKLTKEELDEIYEYFSKLKMHLYLEDILLLEQTVEKALTFTPDGGALLNEQEFSKIEKIFETYDTVDILSCNLQTTSQNLLSKLSTKSTELALSPVNMENGPDVRIHIQSTGIMGARGIKAIIKNYGDEVAYDIDWTLEIMGGIFGQIRKQFSGRILILEPGDEITISTPAFFGLGQIVIEAALANWNYDVDDGRQIFFRTIIN